jgi:hypothetical protein
MMPVALNQPRLSHGVDLKSEPSYRALRDSEIADMRLFSGSQLERPSRSRAGPGSR